MNAFSAVCILEMAKYASWWQTAGTFQLELPLRRYHKGEVNFKIAPEVSTLQRLSHNTVRGRLELKEGARLGMR